jgi:hypothetical protein
MYTYFLSAIRLLSLTAAASMMVSCVSSNGGRMDQSNETRVGLDSNNYRMIRAGARGESRGFKLLGIIPLVTPSFADAKAALYSNSGENLTGRSIAIANQTQDSSTLNLIIFQIPKVTITADIVEFTDRSSKSSRP